MESLTQAWINVSVSVEFDPSLSLPYFFLPLSPSKFQYYSLKNIPETET